MRSECHPSKPQKKGTNKNDGFAANFACGFFDFWKGGTRFLIVFLEIVARRPLTLFDDNTEEGRSRKRPNKKVPVYPCRTEETCFGANGNVLLRVVG